MQACKMLSTVTVVTPMGCMARLMRATVLLVVPQWTTISVGDILVTQSTEQTIWVGIIQSSINIAIYTYKPNQKNSCFMVSKVKQKC